MAAIEVGNGSISTSLSPLNVTPETPSSNSVILVAVAITGATASVTGITGGSATYVQVASGSSSNKRLELWIGYNYGNSYPSSISVYTTSSSLYKAVAARTLMISGDASSMAVASSASSATGSSTSAVAPSLVPATGDIMFVAVARENTADSSARTSTGNVYVGNLSIDGSSGKGVEAMWCQATSATSSSVTWTLTGASSDWVTAQFIWSPGVLATGTGAVAKGLDTATADNASSY